MNVVNNKLIKRPGPTAASPENRFMRLVQIPREDGCMAWQGSIEKQGYGRFWLSGKRTVWAHRFSYELFVGSIPEGLVIDHLCRNRGCVNPAHLEVVTSGENTRRGFAVTTALAARTVCKQGHVLDEANTLRRADGSRRCRTCHRDEVRAWRQRRAEAAQS